MQRELLRLKEENARLKALYEVSQVIHSTLEPNRALDLIVGEAVRVVNASSGSVALVNPTTGLLEIQASRGLPPRAARLRLHVGEGVTGWVVQTGKPGRVDDVRRDARYVAARGNVRSELAVPLEVDGQVRGVLNVDADRPSAFTRADERLLQELARQAAIVIDHTNRHEQLRLKTRLFESLLHVSKTINSALALDEVLEGITREATGLMEAKMCSLMLLDETGAWLDLCASHGAGPHYRRKPRLSVGESLLGVVIRRRRPLQLENVQTSTRYQHVEIARREGLVSLVSVPLLYGEEPIGTLSVYKGQEHRFSNEEIRILLALADLSAVAIQKARLYSRIVDAEDQMRRIEKLSALGLLAAEVAHEIRNPLTVMKMLYHSLNLQFAPADPRAEDARIITEKMEHLNRIVEQSLDFARRSEPQTVEVNVNQLIDELRLLTRHKFSQQHVRVRYRLAPDLPRIKADPAQLEQAFLNLMLNAAEAMPHGGSLFIGTRLARQRKGTSAADCVWVEFRDSGRGMTREQLADAAAMRLASAKPKGTGLGLAIVGRIIENHDGTLHLQSRPGQGTVIRVQLPLAWISHQRNPG